MFRALISGAAVAVMLFVTLLAPVGQVAAAPSVAPSSAVVSGFPAVKQWWGLSCEYAAAAAVTLYYGNLVSQSVFVSEIPQNANPHIGFRGNIYSEAWGSTKDYGIYPEPLVPVLQEHGYNAEVFYGGTARLKSELAAGHPVVVWVTGKANYTTKYETTNSKTYKLVTYEHAVVAYGYNSDGVWIMDVGSGTKYLWAWSRFTPRWTALDQMALVITPK